MDVVETGKFLEWVLCATEKLPNDRYEFSVGTNTTLWFRDKELDEDIKLTVEDRPRQTPDVLALIGLLKGMTEWEYSIEIQEYLDKIKELVTDEHCRRVDIY